MITDAIIDDDSHDIKRILSDAKRTCSECLEAGHYRITCHTLRAKNNSDTTFMDNFLCVEKYSFPVDTFKVLVI